VKESLVLTSLIQVKTECNSSKNITKKSYKKKTENIFEIGKKSQQT
jgi:hypothetical protein